MAELRPFELRDSKQLAIMPADANGLCRYLARRCSNIATQLLTWRGVPGTTLEDTDADDGPEFTPAGADEREQITRGIRLRLGQPAFRNALLDRHKSRCVISACSVLGVLEAAHTSIWGPRDNHPANGLLLRSDLHTLFDLNRIGVDPEKHSVVLHPNLLASEYGELDHTPLLVTQETAPDKRALRLR